MYNVPEEYNLVSKCIPPSIFHGKYIFSKFK